VEQVRRILAGGLEPRPQPAPESADNESRLRSHPTLWGYARRRLTAQVR